MKNILKKYLLAVTFIGVAFQSCNTYDGTDLVIDTRPVLTADVASITMSEGDTQTITVTVDKLSPKKLHYRVELVDESILGADTDLTIMNLGAVDAGDPPSDAFQIEFAPYTSQVTFDLTAILDSLSDELTENKVLRITPNQDMFGEAENHNILIPITIINIPVCTWTVDTMDSWGDGWNGGYLTFDIDGVMTDYFALTSQTIYDIVMPEGAVYSITYTAGSWEDENTYIITAPDGTIYADGPIPTVGLVTSGTNICN